MRQLGVYLRVLARMMGLRGALVLMLIGLIGLAWLVPTVFNSPLEPQPSVAAPARMPVPARANTPSDEPEKTSDAALNLKVQQSGPVLRIANLSNETYHRLLLRLVVGLDFNSFTTTLRDIAPGKTIVVDTREIANSSGERFDAARYKPMVVIEGQLADGRRAMWGGK